MTRVNLNKIDSETGLNKRGRSAEWLKNYAAMCSHNKEMKLERRFDAVTENLTEEQKQEIKQRLHDDLVESLENGTSRNT